MKSLESVTRRPAQNDRIAYLTAAPYRAQPYGAPISMNANGTGRIALGTDGLSPGYGIVAAREIPPRPRGFWLFTDLVSSERRDHGDAGLALVDDGARRLAARLALRNSRL